MNGSSTQRLHFDDGSTTTFKSSGGVSCSKRTAILLFIFAALLVAGVALIVYFVAPPRGGCEVPPTPDEEAQWEACKQLSAKRGECLCETTTKPQVTTVTTPTTPPKPLPTGLRLNKTIIPYHYKVELQPYLYSESDSFGFDGSVEIYVTCNETTDVIVMHIEQITLNETSVEIMSIANNATAPIPLANWEEDVPRQFLKLYPSQALVVGDHYVIKMKFNGTLIHRDYGGFYLSSYKNASGDTRYLGTTQFQRTNARRAFPCFDEPFFKATFDVTLVRRAHYSTISNMPIIAQEPRESDWVADVHDTTVKMSSYLLAFVVSDFKNKTYTTARGTVFRHWARPEYIDYVNYSLSISGRILEAFEDWTNVSYPLSETDQIAIPDFAAGAMENWGLITYREYALLYNPDYTTMSRLRYVASVISHELAHQWFGNLVTCDWWGDTWLNEGFATFLEEVGLEPIVPTWRMWFGNLITCDWWDDTWLNEGFATYFAPIGAAAVEPTWKLNEYFLRTVQNIMITDGAGNSQPIYLPGLEHHSELRKAFAGITYSKGGSVIRMMKYFLGEDTFREGLSEYLKEHEYKTVKRQDLYTALERVAVRKGTVSWDTARANLSSIMQTWIDQMNYPVVEVTDNLNTSITITQRHFLYNENDSLAYPSPIGRFVWDIPFTYASQDDLVHAKSPKLVWMYREPRQLITGVQGGWQLANIWQQGFYRVKYDDETWTKIVNQLMTNYTVIPVENRAQLIDDAFSLAGASLMSETDALRVTEYLRNETEYLPMYSGINTRMTYYDGMFYGTSSYDALQTYVLGLITKPYSNLKWDDSDFSEHLEKLHRANIFREACVRRYRPCVEKAVNLFQQFMNNRNINPISPNWRSSVYCNGIRNGGNKEWEFAKQMYEKEYTEWIDAEKTYLLQGMSCTREPWLIRRYIDYAVEKNSTNMLDYIARQPTGEDAIWSFLKERWNTWPSVLRKNTLINTLTRKFSTTYDLAKLEEFIRDYPDNSLDSVYESARKMTQSNIQWMSKNQKTIESWLRATNAKYA